ncbi:hypothetical protein VC83_08530 [Pseudogymnoascus destructans]|uniref:Uncharacterized protein n=1 Tax=Pseudogymnoascus destructans TaxID=655981 RepID=A0A176ZYL9_9PEZI|nr:uncharacterized protein VC83_08530 [Pseudogymnoascus destructans]OAF54978.1 hypothetical protein VC83_08530 [Pseudogymnoascus destructans]
MSQCRTTTYREIQTRTEPPTPNQAVASVASVSPPNCLLTPHRPSSSVTEPFRQPSIHHPTCQIAQPPDADERDPMDYIVIEGVGRAVSYPIFKRLRMRVGRLFFQTFSSLIQVGESIAVVLRGSNVGGFDYQIVQVPSHSNLYVKVHKINYRMKFHFVAPAISPTLSLSLLLSAFDSGTGSLYAERAGMHYEGLPPSFPRRPSFKSFPLDL